jgi:hypothetical protein
MGPVPCILVPVSYSGILPVFLKHLLSIPAFFIVWHNHAVPSPQGQKPSFGRAFLDLTGSLCLLKGGSLALLKTNFAKKPKNPV